ncbi:hypothetical protein KP509_13G064500 [Ceratopteris richardii]|uniref:Uncharacterized protein n=1 Tax=Ceratopteris richardii TaxID=49495 RepID=A0A8T2TJN0_CERRI|nr:hypothetical protein KP509_13G064500 [Ceratopteris richardii]
MTCRGFIQLLLKIINFLFILAGLAMIGYGIYMVVTYNSSSSTVSTSPPPPPPLTPPPPPPSSEYYFAHHSNALSKNDINSANADVELVQLRRSLLYKASEYELSFLSSFWSSIPSAWFLYTFIGVGVVITLITCSGYIAAATQNGCCLSCKVVHILQVIPEDSTGELDSIESFVEDNIGILKWVALGIIVVEALALLFAVILRAINASARKDYDSDDEYLAPAASRSSRQPLLNRQTTAGTAGNASGSESRPARADAWSTRMREKYGLDTTEFSYNPESKRYPQQAAPAEENKGCCSIM